MYVCVGLPVVRVTENQKALNCVVLKGKERKGTLFKCLVVLALER